MINDEIDSRLGFETRAMMRWWIARSYKIGLLQEKCAIKNRFLPWIDFARVNYLNTRSSRRTLSRGNKMQSGNKSRSNCFQRLRSFLGRKKNNFTAVIPPQKAGRGQQLKRNFFLRPHCSAIKRCVDERQSTLGETQNQKYRRVWQNPVKKNPDDLFTK